MPYHTSAAKQMINRSSNVSARRSGGGVDSGGVVDDDTTAHITDLSTKSSSLSKKLKVKSARNNNTLPLLIAAFALGIIGRPLLIPPPPSRTHHSNVAVANNDYKSDTPSTTKLRGGTNDTTDNTPSNYYQLTPKRKLPKGWQNYSRHDIRSHFKCSHRTRDTNKSLPSLDDWQFLRYAYTSIVDKTKQTKVWDNDVVPPTMGYSIEEGIPIPPPYYAKFSHEKGGRGLYASRFIHKGELVHNGDVSDVIFPSTIKWKEYVLSLPRNLACDVTDWHWMQMKYKGDDYHMVGAMDISLLMNAGGPEWGDVDQKLVNVLPRSKYSGRQYATRDIEMGEEILTDYDAYYTNWKLVGL